VVATGGGGYDIMQVISGCEGTTTTYRSHTSHHDVGAQAEHEFQPAGIVLGARGGVTDESRGPTFINGVPTPGTGSSRTLHYGNPYVSLERRTIGLGVGGMFASEEFTLSDGTSGAIPLSAHLRLGLRHGINMQFRYMEGLPLVAAGEYTDAGFGVPITRRGEGWLGVGFGGPGSTGAMEARARFHVLPSLALRAGGFTGSTLTDAGRGVKATGWNVGIEWEWSPAARDTAAAPP
jgi:hypothetical protein